MTENHTSLIDEAGPDWSQLAHDVLCPLCEYNLRGIREARCPECGYRFTWAEVMDPARRIHPYLYEHHPERSGWSFIRTAWHGLRPKRFWTSLNPAQPSNPQRLRKYWLLCVLLLAAQICGYAAVSGVYAERRLTAGKAAQLPQLKRFYNSLQSPADKASVLKQIQELTTPTYSSILLQQLRFAAVEALRLLPLVVTLIAWPWLTLLTLMIFRWSMRRAAVKPGHVRRCCLYSFDGIWWAGVPFLLALPVTDNWPPWLFICIPFGAWKLYRAYRHYLRFDRPLATVFASQLIVLLAVAQCWLWADEYGFSRMLHRVIFSLQQRGW